MVTAPTTGTGSGGPPAARAALAIGSTRGATPDAATAGVCRCSWQRLRVSRVPCLWPRGAAQMPHSACAVQPCQQLCPRPRAWSRPRNRLPLEPPRATPPRRLALRPTCKHAARPLDSRRAAGPASAAPSARVPGPRSRATWLVSTGWCGVAMGGPWPALWAPSTAEALTIGVQCQVVAHSSCSEPAMCPSARPPRAERNLGTCRAHATVHSWVHEDTLRAPLPQQW